MDCAIWLNRRKIFSADEISANFDIAAIRGYFLGGSLINWLNAHGGEDYALALAEVSPSDPALNDKLTNIFTHKSCDTPVHKADENLIRTIDLLKGGVPVTGSAQSVCGSYPEGSFGQSSFTQGSGSYLLNYGSFSYGSFSYGSFGSFRRIREWEWEWCFGSFRSGSFRYGGGSGAYLLGSYRGYLGSFSYNFGSYSGAFGSFAYNIGSFRSGSFGYSNFIGGSFRGMTLGSFPFDISYGMGSYRGVPVGGSFRAIGSDEYDEIMYRTLNICPLNRFGYGIHLI